MYLQQVQMERDKTKTENRILNRILIYAAIREQMASIPIPLPFFFCCCCCCCRFIVLILIMCVVECIFFQLCRLFVRIGHTQYASRPRLFVFIVFAVCLCVFAGVRGHFTRIFRLNIYFFQKSILHVCVLCSKARSLFIY